MPTIGPLHHLKPGTEAGRLACSEQRSICLSVSTTHASFAGEVQWNVYAFIAGVSVSRGSNPTRLSRRAQDSALTCRFLPGFFRHKDACGPIRRGELLDGGRDATF